jgi:FdrA protein
MPDKIDQLLQNGPVAINLGIQDFAESLRAQGAEVVHVDWTPPAGGDRELLDLLDQLL